MSIVILCYGFATWAYFKTFEKYHFTIATALVASAPIITLMVSPLIGIPETITPKLIIAVLVMVAGIIILEKHNNNEHKINRKHLKWPILTATLYGAGTAFAANIMQHGYTNPITFSAFLFIGEALLFLLIFKPYQTPLTPSSKKKLYKRTILIIAGDLTLFYALATYQSIAALIEAIHEMTVVFSILIGAWIFKEKYPWHQYLVILIMAGTILALYL